jgi:DNA-binding MarR family transcriptional regulator
LRVTQKGEALVADLREHRAEFLSDILRHMTDEEISSLARGYTALLRVAEVHQKEEVRDGSH